MGLRPELRLRLNFRLGTGDCGLMIEDWGLGLGTGGWDKDRIKTADRRLRTEDWGLGTWTRKGLRLRLRLRLRLGLGLKLRLGTEDWD